MTNTATQPGWYTDPQGTTRYFDGTTWTDHVQPVQPIIIQQAARPRKAVMHGTNHALHLTLTVMTCGMWLPVWMLIAIFTRKTVTYK